MAQDSKDRSRAKAGSLLLADQLCFSAYALGLAFSKVYKPILAPLELTYPQYLVMMVLWEQDDLTVNEIGARLGLDSGTLTPLLKRLEAGGRIKRRRDREDERQVRVTLTRAGRALKAAAADVPGRIFCAAGLKPAELGRLKTEIDQLQQNLLASEGG